MMIVNDELFGCLEYKYDWVGRCNINIFNQKWDVELAIEGEVKNGITMLQRETYNRFMEKQAEIMQKVEVAIFEYYQSICEEYRAMFEEKADRYAPKVEKVSDLASMVKPISVIIEYPELPKRKIALLFNTKWDIELGIGMRLVDEEVTFIGAQCDVI